MILCFDIGGTSIKPALGTAPDALCVLPRVPTPTRDFDAFVASLAAVVAALETRPERIALSIAGVVDAVSGRATVANIPCLTGRCLGPEVSERIGIPVLVANDADCFALAEATLGAGRGHGVVLGAILGTGIGGGLVSEGRLIGAGRGFAGEWGHGPVAKRLLDSVPVTLPAYPCGCGLNGCLDATCSARGIERLHRDITGVEATSEEIVARWRDGDAGAVQTVSAWVEVLSGPLAMAVNLTGASVVAVGGGLARDARLIATLDAATRPLTLARPVTPLVVQAQCTVEPGLVGAAILALGRPRG